MLPPGERIAAYEHLTGQALIGHLGTGPGQDGFVLESSQLTAVKFFDRPERYQRERDVYRLLHRLPIEQIAGHNIPRLIRAIDEPCVLDGASGTPVELFVGGIRDNAAESRVAILSLIL